MPGVKETPLQRDLREWAKWVETQLDGYPTTTVVSRAMEGRLTSGAFGPGNPNIDASNHWMRRIIIAMANIEERRKKARYIKAMQMHYLLGEKKVTEILGRPSRTIRDWRKWGEEALELELKK